MLPRYRCKRCGNTWTPRTEKPITCPECRSPYWNKERKKSGGKTYERDKKDKTNIGENNK